MPLRTWIPAIVLLGACPPSNDGRDAAEALAWVRGGAFACPDPQTIPACP